MRHLLSVLCTVAFSVGHCFGQAPEVDWPDSVEQGDLLELRAPDADSYDWAILPEEIPYLLYDRVAEEVFEGEEQIVHRNSIIVVSTKLEGELYISLAISKEGVASTILRKIVVGEGSGDGPGDDSNPLANFVKTLTSEVDTNPIERGEVAEIFKLLTKQIESGDPRGSSAVIKATKAALFDNDLRQNWQQWYTSLATHFLDKLRLVTQSQWAKAYKEVAQGVVK